MNVARLGFAHLGFFRLGPSDPPPVTGFVGITLDGVDITARIRYEPALSITDAINDNANTLNFAIGGTPAPRVGNAFRIVAAVGLEPPTLLFNGSLQSVTTTYQASRPEQILYLCSAIDDSARLEHRRPFGAWTDVSASDVAHDLIDQFAAPEFSGFNIAAGLPTISIVFDGTEPFVACLKRIADRIGGYFYVADLDLHLFLTETSDAPDPIDETPGRFLDDPAITYNVDVSQIRTRVYGRGRGDSVLTALAIGETIIPIADASMFDAAGGAAISLAARLVYTGRNLGGDTVTRGDSSLTPGTPTVGAPSPLVTGRMTGGAYRYAIAFGTESGVTFRGANSAGISIGAVGVFLGGTGTTQIAGGGLVAGQTYVYSWTAATANGQTPARSTFSVTLAAGMHGITFTGVTWSDGRITAANLYRSIAGGTGSKYLVGSAHTSGAPITDTTADLDLVAGELLPTVDTAQGGAVRLSAIPVSSDPRVKTRPIYRTRAGGTDLFLLATIDNVLTVFVDVNGDADLGEPAPLASSVAIPAGRTTLDVADPTPFAAGGGYATVGSTILRYTGHTGGTLTGIPTTGPGALLEDVAAGAAIVAAGALTGVRGWTPTGAPPATGLLAPIVAGDAINLWIERNDLAAQLAMAALEDIGGDGVYEYVITDDTADADELIARCDAELALFAWPLETATYACFDLKTKSGKSAVIDLPLLEIDTTLTIQSVQISDLLFNKNLPPRFTVTASSVRFSLEAFLRTALKGTP